MHLVVPVAVGRILHQFDFTAPCIVYGQPLKNHSFGPVKNDHIAETILTAHKVVPVQVISVITRILVILFGFALLIVSTVHVVLACTIPPGMSHITFHRENSDVVLAVFFELVAAIFGI